MALIQTSGGGRGRGEGGVIVVWELISNCCTPVYALPHD